LVRDAGQGPELTHQAQQNVFTEEKDYGKGENGLSYATDHKVSHSLLQKVFPGHILMKSPNHFFLQLRVFVSSLRARLGRVFKAQTITT